VEYPGDGECAGAQARGAAGGRRAAREGAGKPRAARRERLKAEVGRLFGLHERKYGSPRITADLKDARWRVSANACAPHSRHPSGRAVIYTRAEIVAFLARVYNGGSMTCPPGAGVRGALAITANVAPCARSAALFKLPLSR
jgi:hypothetical protein